MAAAVNQICTSAGAQLLEHLGQLVADQLLAPAEVSAVDVTIKKLRPPLALDIDIQLFDLFDTVNEGEDFLSPKVRAFLGMGSNLGDSRQLLMTAIKNLSDVRGVGCL